jgi:prepilin-type N-terminal cleavage/methylation domain-containing protein
MNAERFKNHHASRPAFTMVELVIVISIIVVLAALLLPMLNKTYKSAMRSKLRADLQTISTALEAYKLDHRDYPRVPAGQAPMNGAVLLCWALVAPGPAVDPNGAGDGADGPGFRTRGAQGQVYGPYIQVDRFKIADIGIFPITKSINLSSAIFDRYGSPIFYCPASADAPLNAPVMADRPKSPIIPKFDYNYFVGSSNIKWVIDLSEAERILGNNDTGSFLLWSAGPNAFFGHDPGTDVTLPNIVSDDVTNFRN